MLSSLALPFALVWAAAAAAVFKVSALHYRDAPVVRILGTILIAFSCSVFQLILCEVLQSGDPEIRAKLWKLVTAVLLGLLAVVSPAVQIWRVVAQQRPKLRVIAVILFGVYLVLFQIAGKQLPLERYHHPDEPSMEESRWYALRQDSLACVSFVGITTMALLCGISSVSAPYTAFFGDSVELTEVDVARLQDSIRSIDEMLATKALQISRLRLEMARKNGLSRSTPSVSLVSRIVGLVKPGDNVQLQLHSLIDEEHTLQKLKTELAWDLLSVQQRLAQQERSKTLAGKIQKLVYAIFAAYCIYRVLNTYVRLGWWLWSSQPEESTHGGPRDALVLLISTTINNIFPDIGVTGWSRLIGVFMSGAVLVASLNGVLRTIQKIMRSITRTTKPLPLDLLVVAQVIGVYVLSLATTLRLNIPRSMSGPIVAAIASPLKVSSVQLWNDAVLSVTSTAVLLAIVCLNHVNNDSVFDEEMAVGGLEKYE